MSKDVFRMILHVGLNRNLVRSAIPHKFTPTKWEINIQHHNVAFRIEG